MRHQSTFLAFVLFALSHASGQSGPTLVGSNYITPPPVTLAPGQIVTLTIAGLKPIPGAPVQASAPLPTQLAGISVTIYQIIRLPLPTLQAPILSIAQSNRCGDSSSAAPQCYLTSITIQTPFELFGNNFEEPQLSTTVTVTQDGVESPAFWVNTRNDYVHVLTTCGTGTAPCVTHPDGTLVTAASPAIAGETVIIYAVGLGATTPAVPTGHLTSIAARVVDIITTLNFSANALPAPPAAQVVWSQAGPPPAFAGLTPGQLGLYQINVQLPSVFPAVASCPGTNPYNPVLSNLTINIFSVYYSSDGAAICVKP